MATFVLVHGAWVGGWYWQDTARRLRAAGHEVYAPTLTGCGERAHLLSASVNLSLHVRDVCSLLRWEELHDVVLVGHSYGGMVVTGVADAEPERIAALAYIDAFVPGDGESLFDLVDEGARRYFLTGAATNGGFAMTPLPPDSLNMRDAAKLASFAGKVTLQPFATFRERLALSGAHERIARRAYFWASDYPRSPFTPFYERAKAAGWETAEIDAGHMVMFDAPERTAELLLGLG